MFFPNAIIKSGLAKPFGGALNYGIPTSEKIINMDITSTNNPNIIRYAIMKIEYPIIIIGHQFEITAAPVSNANARVAIYKADNTLQPIGGPVYDSGNISIASGFTGTKTVSSLSAGLNAGMYLPCIIVDTAMGLRGMQVPSPVVLPGLGADNIAKRFLASQTFGAFPTPGTSWTSMDTDNIGLQHHVVWQWTE